MATQGNFHFVFKAPPPKKKFNTLSSETQNASSIAVFTSKMKSFFLVYVHFTSLSA